MGVNIVNFKKLLEDAQSISVSDSDVDTTFMKIQDGIVKEVKSCPDNDEWKTRTHVGNLKGYAEDLFSRILDKFINTQLSQLELKLYVEQFAGQNHHYIIATYKRGA